MAIFNAALKSGCGPTGVYSAFCESKDDPGFAGAVKNMK